eukprot:6191568-Pleurochrysis_carterae.AAC.1
MATGGAVCTVWSLCTTEGDNDFSTATPPSMLPPFRVQRTPWLSEMSPLRSEPSDLYSMWWCKTFTKGCCCTFWYTRDGCGGYDASRYECEDPSRELRLGSRPSLSGRRRQSYSPRPMLPPVPRWPSSMSLEPDVWVQRQRCC